MNNKLKVFREWFESRNLREKFFVCLLSWAFLYAIFSITLFRPLDHTHKEVITAISKTNSSIKNWKIQIKSIKEIPNTPLYKEWSAHHKNYLSRKKYYQDLLGDPESKDWENILMTVLDDYPNIMIDSIRHSPETIYKTNKIRAQAEAIYQQQLRLSVLGNFQDIVGYLAYLEKTLPNIHWGTLSYEVKEYPIATVEMELSVLYEKPPE